MKSLLIDTSGMSELGAWSVSLLLHIIWWPGFALILIFYYDKKLNIGKREMLLSAPKLKVLLPALLVVIIYNIIGKYFAGASYGTDMETYDLIVTILTVGFFEEIVFRGWFLNALSTIFSERVANIISSILFSIIHLPKWLKAGYDIWTLLFTGISMMILGIFFGLVFRKSRSIWASAIVHSAWDMLSWIL